MIAGPKFRYPIQDIGKSCNTQDEPEFNCPIASIIDEEERKWALQDFCVPLLQGVQHPTEHFENLDATLSTLLSCQLGVPRSSLPVCSDGDVPYEIISSTRRILNRLPTVPQRLLSLPLRNTVSGNISQDR